MRIHDIERQHRLVLEAKSGAMTMEEARRQYDSEMTTREVNARGFIRDLRGVVYGDADRSCDGVMTADRIADIMGIDVERASRYMWDAVAVGESDRQGGCFVV